MRSRFFNRALLWRSPGPFREDTLWKGKSVIPARGPLIPVHRVVALAVALQHEGPWQCDSKIIIEESKRVNCIQVACKFPSRSRICLCVRLIYLKARIHVHRPLYSLEWMSTRTGVFLCLSNVQLPPGIRRQCQFPLLFHADEIGAVERILRVRRGPFGMAIVSLMHRQKLQQAHSHYAHCEPGIASL